MQWENELWITALQIVNVFGIVILFFTYLYVYYISKNKYIGMCSAGWGMYIVLGSLITSKIISNDVLETPLYMISSLLIFYGIYGSINKKIPVLILWASGIVQLYVILTAFLNLHQAYYLIPMYVFQAYLFVMMGISILNTKNLHGFSKQIYGCAFVALGIHFIDYPIMKMNPGMLATGFLISTLLVFCLALASFIHFFHTVKSELSISDSMFKSAFEQTGLGMAMVSTQGEILRANKSFCDMFGYNESELIGKDFLNINLSEIYKFDKQNLITDISGIRQYINEKKCTTKNGQEIWIKVIATLIKDEEENPIHYIIQVENITEQKKWKDKIIQSRNFYLTLFNEFPTMVWSSNDAGMRDYFNKQWLQFTGRTLQQECNYGWRENIHPDDFEKCIHIFDQSLAEKSGFDAEYRVKRADGEWRWIKNIATPYCDIDGSFKGHIGSCYDITDTKIVTEKIISSEKKHRQLIESLPLGIMVHKDGRIIFINNAGLNIIGALSNEQILGTNTLDYIHQDYHEVHMERRKAITQKKQEVFYPLATKLVRMDGSIINVESTAIDFWYEGESCILNVFRDITHEKKIDELKKTIDENHKMIAEAIEYDKLKTEFFANLSHEFRTPINIIFSTIQLLELYTKNNTINISEDKLRKHIASVKQNCYRLLRMANNIIDASKIDSGYLELNLKNYNIIAVVENIVLSVVEYARQKEIEIEFDTEVEEIILACDPDKIERIILNLLSNALKFTKQGGKIFVNIEEADTQIIIHVKDNGIGIPEDKLNDIFERFVQVDKTLARSCEGSGIGLSIVKSLVEMHGGSIRVDSKLGEGTEFIIELPIRIVEGEVQQVINNIVPGIESKDIINIEFSDIA